jgi:hypothetical protein
MQLRPAPFHSAFCLLHSPPLHSALCILHSILLISCTGGSQTDLPLLASYDFDDGSTAGFSPKVEESWQVVEEDGSMVYTLLMPGEFGEIRAPSAWSVISEHVVGSFEFTGRLKCHTEPETLARDMVVLFHFQDPTHFYYVHFSATSDGLHNIIGLVNGADRVKINREPAGESVVRLTDRAWHDFKVTYDSETAEIQAYLDDMDVPIITASDSTLPIGLVGVGSFDDLRLAGEVVAHN